MAERPKTVPETPIPKALAASAVAIGVIEARLDHIDEALQRLEAKPHLCVQEARITAIDTRHKIISGIIGAIGLIALGTMSTVLVTCQSTSHAAGVNETRIENHSTRLKTLEDGLSDLNKSRIEDTKEILAAIRGEKIRRED